MHLPVRNLLLLLALIGGATVWFSLRETPESTALRQRTIAVRKLTEAVRRQHPGERVLVISNPFSQRAGVPKEIREVEDAGVRGVSEALDQKIEMVGFPDLRPEAIRDPRSIRIDPQSPTPLSFLVAEDSFDKLMAAHARAGIIISLIGLPVDLERVSCWNTAGPPHFGLLFPDLRMIGNATAVQGAMKSGKLAAFVLNKPGAPGLEAPMGKDLASEFDKRFLLVTPENIEAIIAKHPTLFPAAGLE